jgi:hypothetical protein
MGGRGGEGGKAGQIEAESAAGEGARLGSEKHDSRRLQEVVLIYLGRQTKERE